MFEGRGRSTCLSNYYRQRFGSHSPEEYMNLRITGFDAHLTKEEIKKKLTHEIRKFAPFEIKVVQNPEDLERLAYVNFERRKCARTIRYTLLENLRKLLGRDVFCDPAGILRDQEGKFIPDRFNKAQNAYESPTTMKEPMNWKLKQDDSQATRTLFIGNLPFDVKEKDLRQKLGSYGKVEDVEIKNPMNGDSLYAFVMLQSVEQAVRAKNDLQEKPFNVESDRCMKIGYGKSKPSRRLWIGGIGPWCGKQLLEEHFCKFGKVEDIELMDEFAYITYERDTEAEEACQAMRGYPLGGGQTMIMVDFAKVASRKRRLDEESKKEAEDRVESIEQLEEVYAPTWTGKMSFKTSTRDVKFYRIYGSELLVYKLMKNEGIEVELKVKQRLPQSTQDALLQTVLQMTDRDLSIGVIANNAPLCEYLQKKEAIGVVSVQEGGMLYMMPKCKITRRLIDKFAENVRLFEDGVDGYLLGVLVKKN